MTEKHIIRNRHKKRIAVVVDSGGDKGLVFVMHGLGGFKEDVHVAAFAEWFVDRGLTVVRFDAANTLGESEGKIENATITNYFEDLEDIIAWARTRDWYREPFIMAGHSLGGICTSLYAQKYPDKVRALAPISTVVSGKLSVEAHERHEPERFAEWKRTGWREDESRSRPGLIKRLPWAHIEDRLKYDLTKKARDMKMPILLVVGEEDASTPPDHVKIFYDALKCDKEFHVIKKAPHTFRDPLHLAAVKHVFQKWINRVCL